MDMLAKILKRASEKGMTQSDLARAAAVDPARITEWKKGEWQPNVGQFSRMGRTLGLSLDFLADDSLAEPPKEPEPLSDDARVVLAIIDALKLKLPDVIRALNALSVRPSESPSGGYAVSIARRDLSGSTTEAERNDEGAEVRGNPAGAR
jgi:transcriptional regulator with XRE-family HTH domain